MLWMVLVGAEKHTTLYSPAWKTSSHLPRNILFPQWKGWTFRQIIMRNAWICRDWVLFLQENVHKSQQKEVYWSVCSAITEYQRPGGFNSRNLFFTLREARGPRSRCQKIWSLVRLLCLAWGEPFSLSVFTWPSLCVCTEREWGLVSCLFFQGIHSFRKGALPLKPSLTFNYLL